MTDEEKAKEYWHLNHNVIQLYDNDEKNTVIIAYLDGLAEGRKEVREHETTCVNRLHHVEKENEELHKLIKDYENDSVEALCKVNDLKAQINKMKCCENCKHGQTHLQCDLVNLHMHKRCRQFSEWECKE